MDLNRMTERLQQGLMEAQSLAVKNNHQEVDEPHIFLALMDQEDSLIVSTTSSVPRDPMFLLNSRIVLVGFIS